MRSVLWFSLCLVKLSSSASTGISPKEDATDLIGVFNVSGFLSLRHIENITIDFPIPVRISGSINVGMFSREAHGSRKHIASTDDAFIQKLEPVFRKDYSLDEQERGWFKLHRVPDTWSNARERCELEGAELASPLDFNIKQAMLTKMEGPMEVFTGIHSTFSYGDYYSLKGVPLTDMPVRWSYEVDSSYDKRCVELLPGGIIKNVKCNSKLPYICYKENNYTPLTACGTIDKKYIFNNQLQTCYKLHTKSKTWSVAFKTCSAEGGHITIINDDVEMAVVVQLFNNDTANGKDLQYSIFVGLQMSENSEWRTIHGQKLEQAGFSVWSPNSNNNDGNTRCGALKREGLLPVSCDYVALPFVCEKKPHSLLLAHQHLEVTESLNI